MLGAGNATGTTWQSHHYRRYSSPAPIAMKNHTQPKNAAAMIIPPKNRIAVMSIGPPLQDDRLGPD